MRFTGCNLRCVWCDTAYAFHGGEKTTVGDVVAKLTEWNTPLVELTGGEPLLHKGCPPLAEVLLEMGFTVLCETSGSLPISLLPADVIKIMDLKCPGSGECDKNDWSNIGTLSEMDEVKFVIADRADYEWARDVVRRYDLSMRCAAVLFSSVFAAASPREIVEWILEDDLAVRLIAVRRAKAIRLGSPSFGVLAMGHGRAQRSDVLLEQRPRRLGPGGKMHFGRIGPVVQRHIDIPASRVGIPYREPAAQVLLAPLELVASKAQFVRFGAVHGEIHVAYTRAQLHIREFFLRVGKLYRRLHQALAEGLVQFVPRAPRPGAVAFELRAPLFGAVAPRSPECIELAFQLE